MDGNGFSGASSPVPVAVVGIGCRLPGAHGPDELWRLIRDGVDAVSDAPPARTTSGRSAPGAPGGYLEHIEEFDAGFFGISPREAVRMDPQQRILLETAWEAFEDAGLTEDRLRGSRTGVFVGLQTGEYWELLDRAGADGGLERDIHTVLGGGLRSVLSGRIAYAFDLRGPAVSVDTACSSSLVAVHQAVRSIRGGEAEQAVVGGTNLVLQPRLSSVMTEAGMLAPDGRCKFGDAGADGFVRSEGVAVVVLKPLDRALADGDDVYAVIRGTASLNDGQASGSLMAPAVEGQRRTLLAAYADAGIDPADADYVEAHGTGTSVGDPVELEALGTVLGAGRPDDRPCLVGSVKTNVGHTEGAAGITGLIKAALCLKEGVIPPSLHFLKPHPLVPWEDWHLSVPDTAAPWPDTGARERVAGVSSFGISGTNAHLVLTGPPERVLDDEPGPARTTADEAASEEEAAEDAVAHVLPLSARDPQALTDLARAHAEHLAADGRGVPLRDLCHSAGTRRSHFEYRTAVVGADHDELRSRLEAVAEGRTEPGVVGPDESVPRQVAFVFPGQGAQWTGMARGLLRDCSEFRRAMGEFEREIDAEAGWSVLDLFAEADLESAPIDRIQPALVAFQASLARVLRDWGVEPDLVVGHSMGEITAAYTAGALDIGDAVRVICRRSALMRRFSGEGAMMSVALPVEAAEEEAAGFADRVSVAVVNGPATTVLSGERAAIEEIRARLEARDVFCRMIRVDVASHSPQMDDLRAEMLDGLGGLTPRATRVPLWSTTDAAVVDGTGLDARHWMRNLREPVRFGPVVREIAGRGSLLCCEISPHPILFPALLEILGDDNLAVAPLRRGRPERTSLVAAAAELYVAGQPVDWSAPAGDGARFVRLPTYPWQRERFWYTDQAAGATGPGEEPPLLGSWRADADGTDVWEGRLDLTRNAFLLEHRVEDEPIFPGVGYVELVLEALAGSPVPSPVGGQARITGLALERALFLDPAREPRVRLCLRPPEPGADGATTRGFEVSSRDGDEGDASWTLHARGLLRFGEGGVPGLPDASPSLAEVRERCRTAVPAADFYRSLGHEGNQWHGPFRGITALWQGDGEVLTRLELAEGVPTDGFQVHPCLLDACLHGVIAAKAAVHGPGGSIVGGGLGSLVFRRRPDVREPLWCHARLTGLDPNGYRGEARLFGGDGELIAELRGVGIRYLEARAEPEPGAAAGVPAAYAPTVSVPPVSVPAAYAPAPAVAVPPGAADDSGIYHVRWEEAAPVDPSGSSAEPSRFLVYADAGGVGEALAARLRSLGSACTLVRAGEDFRQVDTEHYTLEPGSAEHHRRLLDDTAAPRGDGDGRIHAVHLWSLDADSLADAERRGCLDVLALTRALTEHGAAELTLVTSGAQPVEDTCPHPEQAMLWGLGRGIAGEHPALRLRLMDLDLDPDRDPDDRGAGARLAAELAHPGAEDQVALRDGRRLVPRLRPYQGTGGAVRPAPSGPVELAFLAPGHGGAAARGDGRPGTLDALRTRPVAAPRPPGHGEVAIEAEAASIGFRGVLVAMGVLEIPDDPQSQLGYEFSGTVTALGPGVRGLSVGDQVLALSCQPLSNHVVTRAELVCRRPANLDALEATTIPAPFVTADLALRHLARLRPGEKVLVHSAAGGVGLAALQIARLLGAEVYATAGTSEKRSLLRYLGATVVGDSRSAGFASAVREATDGYGVDVVLNMLSGEPRAASFDLLAPYGRWIELTKQDLRNGVPLDPRPFDRALSFISMDVTQMTFDRPEVIGSSLRAVTDLVARGHLQPLPFRTFPAERAGDAFRLMARSGHTGRVVLSFDRAEPPRPTPSSVRPDAGYLITGGVGDLGLEVARRFVDRGARHLLLVGRSPLDDRRAAAVRELSRRASVTYEVADVADEQAMGRVLADWTDRGGPRLRGVVHAAGVMAYADVTSVTASDLSDVLRPKAHGALVLDRLLSGHELDFCVMFSSGSALLPSPLLGVYAAANAYLDALAHHRRGRGAAATSVNWGFWAEVGMAARYERENGRDPAPEGMRSFAPAEALDVLDHLLADGAVQAALLPTDWAAWARSHPAAASVPFLSAVVPGSPADRAEGGDDRTGRTDRAAAVPRTPAPGPEPVNGVPRPRSGEAAPVDEASPAVEGAAVRGDAPDGAGGLGVLDGRDAAIDYLRRVIGQVLGLPAQRVHARRALNRQGLDSLMAVEIRARVRRDAGVDVPIVKFLNGGSPADLADVLLERVAAPSDAG